MDVFKPARPEWVAKYYIINIYFKVTGLEAAAFSKGDKKLLDLYKSGVRQLYRILRPKIIQYGSRLGMSKEKIAKYEEYMKPSRFRKLTLEEVSEWFNDIQIVLERLGYTKFEKGENIESALEESRRGW
ncbi:hypothetical protein [Pyrococcus kukulkanii]|uniref:hypothetical protein n=1 Tax=Pyrococcus kukulkanii TaxID=1609559 RepID=UPI003568FC6A